MSRTPIQTALARHGGKALAVPVDLGEEFGGVVEYEFNPNVGTELIDRMGSLSDVGNGDSRSKLPAQFAAMMDLLRLAATGATAERIAADVERRALDVGAVMALGNAVIEELTDANPTRRSPSPTASPEPGVSSTDGALLGTPTPQTSLPGGS